MQCYDVALWFTPFSWWPDYLAYVYADAASVAVVQLMRTLGLRCVYKASVTAKDGLCRSWWDMECSESEVECETV